jgi:AraC-like DNA-binding protein
MVREGAGTHIIDDVPYSVSRGDVYVMRPGSRHLYTQCRDLTLDALYFPPEIFDETTRNDLATIPGFGALFIVEPISRYDDDSYRSRTRETKIPGQYDGISAKIAELRSVWQENADNYGRASLIRSLLVQLIVHLARYYGAGPDAEATASRIPPAASSARIREATVNVAIKHMREHLDEPLRIDQIAASVFLSPDHFSKVFAAVVGQSPSDYLRQLRVEESKRLLIATDEPITSIGMTVGFNQGSYFTRVFRAFTGSTPRAYREASRRNADNDKRPSACD